MPRLPPGLTGQWGDVSSVLTKVGNPVLWRNAKRRATLRECHRLRGLMVEAFNAGGPAGHKWKGLSTFTRIVKAAQGKTDPRPLMDSGDLRNSHSVVEEDEDTFFVGVHRTTRGRKSKKAMVNIALVHENGSKPIHIRVTPKMRWWWIKVLVKASGGRIKPLKPSTTTIVVRIPARPWVGPIWDAEQDNSAKNIMNGTISGLGIPMFAGLVR